MTNTMIKNVILIYTIFLVGCQTVYEPVKMIWGSSTYRLEKERVNAIRETFNCSLAECFEAVLDLTETKIVKPANDEDQEEVVAKYFDLFLKKPEKSMMVVMNVPGNIDTTEVGIFFSRVQQKTTSVEISSLSSSAKRTVSEIIFKVLRERFQ